MQFSYVAIVVLVLWGALLQPIHGAEEAPAPQLTIEPEETPGYRAPLSKQNAGENSNAAQIVDRYNALKSESPPTDLRRLIPEEMAFLVNGRDDIILDLTDDQWKLKNIKVIVKEGTEYQIRLGFKVHHKSITGLRYEQRLTRKGLNIGKETNMIGTYVPMTDQQTWVSVAKQAPSGWLARGKYKIHSKMYDDDYVYFEWQWEMDVKKDWN